MPSPSNFERLQSKETNVSKLKKKNRRGIVFAWKEKQGAMQGSRRADPVSVYVIYDPSIPRRSENYVVAFGSNPGLRLGRTSWGLIPGDAYHDTQSSAKDEALRYMRSRS